MNQFEYIRSRGFSGALNDITAAFYRSLGAVGGSLQDLETDMLDKMGIARAALQDRWKKFLANVGYQGDMQGAWGEGFTDSNMQVEYAKQLMSGSKAVYWRDPSDLSTLFQDSAGTTPVTAVEQPVGLVLDKKTVGQLGPELTTPFTAANWATSGTDATHIATFSGGTLRYQSDTTTPVLTVTCSALFSAIPAGTYLLTVNCSSWTSGQVKMLDVGGSGNLVVGAAGVFTARISLPANSTLNIVRNSANVDLTISSISLRAIPGVHFIQATPASRPTLSSRYNLLTKTEQFDDAVWLKSISASGVAPVVTPNAVTAPDGTLTADRVDFSRPSTVGDGSFLESQVVSVGATVFWGGVWVKAATAGDIGKAIQFRHVSAGALLTVVLTAEWQLIGRDETAIAGSRRMQIGYISGGTGTQMSVHLWGASLVPAADASLPYQRVNTATDYDFDFSKFPPYLRYDGVDDSQASAATVDLTGTDKITVVGAWHKASDAAIGVLLEIGSNSGAVGGSFMLTTAGQASAGAKYGSTLNGTSLIYSDTATTYPAPISSVISLSNDISGSVAATEQTMRINGGAVSLTTVGTSAGTGNFGNLTVNIGSRNGASLRFNGREYGHALFNTTLTATELATVEAYYRAKSRAY